jgi:hypothetical protein
VDIENSRIEIKVNKKVYRIDISTLYDETIIKIVESDYIAMLNIVPKKEIVISDKTEKVLKSMYDILDFHSNKIGFKKRTKNGKEKSY